MSALSLFAPEAYTTQFERLSRKARARHFRREPKSHGLPLSALQGHAKELCLRLAQDVSSGRFEFAPLSRVNTWAQGKQRTIHRPELLDALVLGVMAQRLTHLLEPLLLDSVFAYRPGRGPQHAITRVQSYLAEHRRARPDVRSRGVFVVQRDLSAFGESIPTHATSRLWPLLDSALATLSDPNEARVLRALLEVACKPEVKGTNGERSRMQHGLPTGSPIQQPLANLYLTPLDQQLTALEPGLYARFGDDLLLLDDDVERAQRTRSCLQQVCAELELGFSAHKARDLYFTGPGRCSAVARGAQFGPASHVEYLGVRIAFGGQLGLKRKRLRQLLQRTRLRVANTAVLTTPQLAQQHVAAAVAHALFSDTRLTEPLCGALKTWVDDRGQLRQLDRLLAQACAEVLSGRRGVKALRHTPPKALRAAGLPSLLQLRRRAGAKL